jgi:hypothetical protein
LDHETSYKRSEPDSQKTKWQKEYLQYLLEQKQTSEARKLIAVIESTITRRYARPFWLRTAALRLDIREGRVATAYDTLARLAGVETSATLTELKPPSIERLNDAVKLLREEGHELEATALLEAAYAREIALEQYQPAYLTGLATISFERGDAGGGLKWLQALVNLGNEESKAETEGELAALPLIKKHAVETSTTELPAANEGITEAVALRAAAETAAHFSQFATAANYRRSLLAIAPDDEENRIEFVRLLAANKQSAAAIENLALIIGDRLTTRKLRWQAVRLAPEITGQKPEQWNTLRGRVRAINPNDTEMGAALAALELAASGQSGEAVKLLIEFESKNPNPALRALQASLERDSGQESAALNSNLQSLIEGSDSGVWQAWSFVADPPLDQIVRLYLKQSQPRAALQIVERSDGHFASLPAKPEVDQRAERQEEIEVNKTGPEGGRYQTLHQRAELRERTARIELLEFLSLAAEQIGDLNRAIALEQARLALVAKTVERQTAERRLDQLRAAQKKVERQSRPTLVVDQRLVAGG